MRPFLVVLLVALALSARLILGPTGNVFAFVALFLAVCYHSFIMLRDLVRGHFGVDIIALLAMIGALLVGEWWAGIVVLVMLTGGAWLEAHAFKRAQSELTALLKNAPTIAHVKVANHLHDTPIDELMPGHLIVIKPGETVPIDALVLKGASSLDASRLTGEPLPVAVRPHEKILAGSINQEGLLEARVLVSAKDSQYSRIRTLIAEAQAHKAPFVRLADHWSGWFTLLTLTVTALAWFISHDPVRALAVLVVATPCPLLLATPIAFLSGMNRAFKQGIIVKHGGALEVLAKARTYIFDKTGTLTFGEPRIQEITGFGRKSPEILQIAASLDQGSSHALGKALVNYAHTQNISLFFPKHLQEITGQGVIGELQKDRYVLGRLSFLQDRGVMVPRHVHSMHEVEKNQGKRTIYLARENWLIGSITFTDVLRPGIKDLLGHLRELGVKNLSLLTGDRSGPARVIAKALAIKDVRAECLPTHKVEHVKKWQKRAAPVVMVGDGMNDAPALAQADLGIAVGVHGEGASSEAADVVMVNEHVEGLESLIHISRRTLSIAKNSIFLGMGLSLGLMLLALLGFIPPLLGAWLQEGIDVAVILYALQARRG